MASDDRLLQQVNEVLGEWQGAYDAAEAAIRAGHTIVCQHSHGTLYQCIQRLKQARDYETGS